MKSLLSTLSTVYTGPANSQEYTELFNTIHQDLSRLYGYSTINDYVINNNMDILIRENYALQKAIIELEQKVSDIALSANNAGQLKYISKSFTTAKDTYSSVTGFETIAAKDQAYVDTINDVVMLPIGSSHSRVHSKDMNNNLFVPALLNVSVYQGTKADELSLIDPIIPVNNMVNGDNISYWYNTIQSTADEIYFRIEITLPVSSTTNYFVNNICMSPFPVHDFTLTDVRYIDTTGAEKRIDSYPMVGNNPMEIQAFQRTRFTFNKIEPTKVIIEGKQPNFYQEGSTDRLFQYGFQNIDISFDEYQTSQAKIITKFDISKYNKKFKLISVPTAREAMGSLKNINNYIEHRLYYLTNGDTTISEYDFNADLPVLDCDKIYISTTIKAVNGVSPLISNIAVGFETR